MTNPLAFNFPKETDQRRDFKLIKTMRHNSTVCTIYILTP